MPSRRALKATFITAAVLVALQGIALLVYFNGQREPAATVERADGTWVSVPEGPLLLHFWATWCAPCRPELPELLAFGRRLAATDGPPLLAVSLDRDWELVRDFFAGEVPDEVVRAADLSTRYDIGTLPVTLLLDAEGRVQRRFDGAQNWNDPAMLHTLRDR